MRVGLRPHLDAPLPGALFHEAVWVLDDLVEEVQRLSRRAVASVALGVCRLDAVEQVCHRTPSLSVPICHAGYVSRHLVLVCRTVHQSAFHSLVEREHHMQCLLRGWMRCAG